jgi:hypothetical protein
MITRVKIFLFLYVFGPKIIGKHRKNIGEKHLKGPQKY